MGVYCQEKITLQNLFPQGDFLLLQLIWRDFSGKLIFDLPQRLQGR